MAEGSGGVIYETCFVGDLEELLPGASYTFEWTWTAPDSPLMTVEWTATVMAEEADLDIRYAEHLPLVPESMFLDITRTDDGVLVIKAQEYRSQEQNREQALARLQELVRRVAVSRKKRILTKPSRSSQRKRMDSKTKRGHIKALRRRVEE